MGIKCQINLSKTSDGVFLAGSNVSGNIQYTLDEVTLFDKITVSLKGQGNLMVHDDRESDRYDMYTYTNREVYIDEDDVTKNEKKTPLEAATHEKCFDFKLPDEIPSSLNYYGANSRFRVKCNVIYYIRIKFVKPGVFRLAKRFKREITVLSPVKPTLLMEPIIYGNQKKIFQLLLNKTGIIKLKTTIKNSVIQAGGNIDIECEVQNDTTNVTVKGVVTKLMESYLFMTYQGREIKTTHFVDNTETKTGSIKNEESKKFQISLTAPPNKASIGYCKMVSRNYFVQITVELPFPHSNIVLDMPLEIICGVAPETESDQEALEEDAQAASSHGNPPPPYWVAMGEAENLPSGDSNDQAPVVQDLPN